MKLLIALICGALFAAEGKWTPRQVLELDPAMLRKMGLEIPPGKIWDPVTGKGLLSAVINTGGCSGAFISSTGLFITNHHCLFGIVQQHSTPEHDYITNGFLAGSEAAELRGRSSRVTAPFGFTDVTREILAAIPPGADDAARRRAIESRQNQIVETCEKQKGHRCDVAAYDGGVSYVLADAMEFADVRLVYAPPRSVGEFGGEVDNFAWPRHTGDFAIGRVYVDGAPYHPPYYFPLSKTGVKTGSFVMVMGYPGVTFRSLTVAEMSERRDLFYPGRVDLFGEWIRILEERSKDSTAAAIAVAEHLKSLNNTFKNAQGQLQGFARGRILEKQEEAERSVIEWARARSEFRDAVAARDELKALAAEQKRTWQRDFLLSNATRGSKALYFAVTLARVARERAKPNAEREPEFMDRELPRLGDRLEREQASLYVPADKLLFASFARRHRGAPVDVEALYAGTRVLDPAERRKMFNESAGQLQARHDPMLDYGFAIAAEMKELREREQRWNGAISRLRPVWRRAVIAHAGKPVAPDANSSLRVSFASVKGYEPRDAVIYKPQSTLAGMFEKVTGQEPFTVPADVAAARADLGPWMDADLKDVPVDFLADADTTGGNSGSPAVNGRGELVGVNFDRVWENVANDFGYNPAVARNVCVDVRYLLWMLDRVKHGSRLLHELGVQ